MPKGKKDTKKKTSGDQFDKEIEALEAQDDEDGIPKHAVTFKLEFEIKHIDIQDYII